MVDPWLSGQKLGFENGQKIGKALLKYAYRNGKADALDYLCQHGLVRSREELLVEIVQKDEQGADTDFQAMAQMDTLPLGHKSLSSARPAFPSQTQEETNTPTAQAKQFAQFMRGSNTDDRLQHDSYTHVPAAGVFEHHPLKPSV